MAKTTDTSPKEIDWIGFFAALTEQLAPTGKITAKTWQKLSNRFPAPTGTQIAKDDAIAAYRQLTTGPDRQLEFNEQLWQALQMKPMRTQSGVTPVTVLTKPFPCPGQCIFCPNDIRMPKSYLSDEPGAQRAERNNFDPYLQTYNRLQAFHNIGHPVEKIEIIVLGGTWSYYPECYQIWFIKECFRAMNDFGQIDDRPAVERRYQEMQAALENQQQPALTNDPVQNQSIVHSRVFTGDQVTPGQTTYNRVISELYVAPERLGGFDQYQMASWDALTAEHRRNETAGCRNVGLVIETRPDNISEAEVKRIRRLGCTKTQIGFQSLQDNVLSLNKRGHDVAATRRAVRLLRQAGFKIHAHWMANLYGSSVKLDQDDYSQLFTDPDFRPDELKIYPCSLIESAELLQYYQDGRWQPYTHEELLEVLTFCLTHTPEYCRLTRVIRDIPSGDIVTGNKLTNFRQIAEAKLTELGQQSRDIRAREIRRQDFDPAQIELQELSYVTSVSQEMFLQYTVDGKLLAFLRLSLPTEPSFIAELDQAAMVREVHVYGPAVGLGRKGNPQAQHQGLGTRLLARATEIAREQGFAKLAVISAIGTREYYRSRGFVDGELYQFKPLT